MIVGAWSRLSAALGAFDRADANHRSALSAFVLAVQAGRPSLAPQKAAEQARSDREVCAHLLAYATRELLSVHETDGLLSGLDTQRSCEEPQ
jgi:hypothetical protein